MQLWPKWSSMRSSWPAWTNPLSAWSCTEPSLQGYKACPCNWQTSWLNLLKITRGCLNFVLEVRFFFFFFWETTFFCKNVWLSYQVKRLEKTCHAYLESSFVYFLNDDYVNSEWPCVTRRARNSWTHCGPRGFMSLKWVESLNSKTYF